EAASLHVAGRDPKIFPRVFKQAEDEIAHRQPVLGCVNCFRSCVRQAIETVGLGKTIQALPGGKPPFSPAVLQSMLVPTPSIIRAGQREMGADRRKSLPIETVNKVFFFVHNAEPLEIIFKNAANTETAEPVCLVETRNSGGCDTHGPAAFAAEPKI